MHTKLSGYCIIAEVSLLPSSLVDQCEYDKLPVTKMEVDSSDTFLFCLPPLAFIVVPPLYDDSKQLESYTFIKSNF